MNGVDKNPVGFASRVAFFLLFLTFGLSYASLEPHLGSARVVFQTNYGDIEFGFFREIAPKTVDHIFKLVRLGCYNTNHFFRVDKWFVAQVADVSQGRSAPMNEEQIFEAKKTVVGEFSKVKHVRGTLSMGRYSDPDSGSSSFSILLGDAPHLDEQYAIFGWVTKGEDTLKKLEEVPTRREGIFVMPTERITILSTYFYDVKEESCEWEKTVLKRKLAESAIEVERQVAAARLQYITTPPLRLQPLFPTTSDQALNKAITRSQYNGDRISVKKEMNSSQTSVIISRIQ